MLPPAGRQRRRRAEAAHLDIHRQPEAHEAPFTAPGIALCLESAPIGRLERPGRSIGPPVAAALGRQGAAVYVGLPAYWTRVVALDAEWWRTVSLAAFYTPAVALDAEWWPAIGLAARWDPVVELDGEW